MKVLFVCPWVPGPQRPRAYGLLAMLAQDHEVRVICLQDRGGDAARLRAAIPGVSVEVVRWHRSMGLVRAAWALVSGRSLQVALVAEKSMRIAVAENMRAWEPDVLHVNVIRSAGYIPKVLGRTRLIFDADERRSDYYRQVARASSSRLWRMISRVEAKRLAKAEDEVVRDASATMVSSPADTGVFDEPAQLVRSPHKVHEVVRAHVEEGTVLFLGRMNYQANVEAVLEFAKKVLPRVLADVPNARLLIVGSSPTKEVRSLASASVDVIGEVDEVDSYYASSAVAIVPNQLATGVQMKLIQAAAAGTPLVATSDCLDRAGLPDGAALSADNADEWVTAVVETLTDPAGSIVRSAEAKDWALANYSDEAIATSLRQVYAGMEGR